MVITFAGVVAVYSFATPGVNAPNDAGAPSVNDNVAGTVPPTVPVASVDANTPGPTRNAYDARRDAVDDESPCTPTSVTPGARPATSGVPVPTSPTFGRIGPRHVHEPRRVRRDLHVELERRR